MKALIKKTIIILSVLPLLSVTTLYANSGNMSKSVDFHSDATTNPVVNPQFPGSDVNPGDINRGLQDRIDHNRSDLNRTDINLNKTNDGLKPVSPTQTPGQSTVNPTQFPGTQTAPLTGPK